MSPPTRWMPSPILSGNVEGGLRKHSMSQSVTTPSDSAELSVFSAIGSDEPRADDLIVDSQTVLPMQSQNQNQHNDVEDNNRDLKLGGENDIRDGWRPPIGNKPDLINSLYRSFVGIRCQEKRQTYAAEQVRPFDQRPEQHTRFEHRIRAPSDDLDPENAFAECPAEKRRWSKFDAERHEGGNEKTEHRSNRRR